MSECGRLWRRVVQRHKDDDNHSGNYSEDQRCEKSGKTLLFRHFLSMFSHHVNLSTVGTVTTRWLMIDVIEFRVKSLFAVSTLFHRIKVLFWPRILV